jgi:hypothetical protein
MAATLGGVTRRWAARRATGYNKMALLWVLNLADGRHSLLDMGERAGVPFATPRAAGRRSCPSTCSRRHRFGAGIARGATPGCEG